jgi:ATP-binding cassette subfamily B protein
MISMIMVMLVMSIECIKRIGEILEEEPTIDNPENPIYEVENGDIEFDNVDFKYSLSAEKNTLENLNLKIKSGQFIGVLGATGSGKTSLVNLISRLYDVTDGSVKVAGHDVREYDLDTLRNEVAVVLQKNVLFSGTIASNLRWGKEDATVEEMLKAMKIAQASELAKDAESLERKVEQGGTNFSGGQKQRLCIARAILKNPKILILDDSTSAVDTKTDKLIRSALKNDLKEMTKIVIAQRISSIEEADQIIVMNDGRIEQIGTHDELLKTNSIYQEVYNTQNRVGGNK